MSVEIRVRARARRDLEEATQWYEAQGTGLGSDFLDEVERAFEKIAENPLAYPEVHRESRRALLQRFPFGVFYRVTKEAVTVIAVMHSSRDPRRWMTRT